MVSVCRLDYMVSGKREKTRCNTGGTGEHEKGGEISEDICGETWEGKGRQGTKMKRKMRQGRGSDERAVLCAGHCGGWLSCGRWCSQTARWSGGFCLFVPRAIFS